MSILRHLRNERGNILLSGLIGSIVTLAMIGVIGGSIVGFTSFRTAITAIANRTTALATLDSSFRTDVQWATRVRPTDSRSVELTVPGTGGKCRTAVWSAALKASLTVVQVTVTNYPATNTTTSPVTCSGTPTPADTQVIVPDAAAASSFGYTNAVGRALKATAGVIAYTDPAAPAPVGVSAGDWADLSVAMVALTTTLDATTPRATAYRLAQSADTVNVAPAVADAPGYPVLEGDLTPLP